MHVGALTVLQVYPHTQALFVLWASRGLCIFVTLSTAVLPSLHLTTGAASLSSLEAQVDQHSLAVPPRKAA